ncbi:hypothetical protein GH714_011275 [Hevea brasiliensis]|uniref:Uncharacterized protein n=1 Tax=Hevea brasiliensis TaxID=3981 RepID=A0A6A6MU30_HEVBR|nr:hypothetical protein GH714_011275 [Hevea brasiliensis]
MSISLKDVVALTGLPIHGETSLALATAMVYSRPAGKCHAINSPPPKKAKPTVTPFEIKRGQDQHCTKFYQSDHTSSVISSYYRVSTSRLCNLSEIINIIGCDSPEQTPRAPSDISVVKPPVAHASSNFRPLAS